MPVKMHSLVGWWAVLLLSAGSLAAAANDLRLVDAVEHRDSEAVRALLQQHVDVNTPQPDGATALHWAARWDDLDTADLLLRAGARVNAANDYGVTPLSLATTNGSVTMVERLLKASANPNAVLPTGETVLMTAARTGNADVVKALVADGADVSAKEPTRGQTALMWAAAEGHAEVVRVLLDHGADVRARSTAGFTPLLLVARIADLETTRILLAAGANVNEAAADGTTALLVATIRGHTAYGEFLLDQGADPNAGPGFTPLHWAAGDQWGGELSDESTGLLAEDNEWTALGGLRGSGKLAFVKLLLAHGADPNARATTNPRFRGLGHVNLVGGRGKLVGATPFLIAAKAIDLAVMRVLLAAGADPMVATNQGTTSLMIAAGVGYSPGQSRWVVDNSVLEAVKLCVELGNDVSTVNAAGETALHGAAYRGAAEDADALIQFLVDKGANLNVKTRRGWTPLVIAEGIYTSSDIRSPSAAALLRKLGAEPSRPDVIRVGATADALLEEQARQKR